MITNSLKYGKQKLHLKCFKQNLESFSQFLAGEVHLFSGIVKSSFKLTNKVGNDFVSIPTSWNSLIRRIYSGSISFTKLSQLDKDF